ncbi:MAG: EamA family transporter [Firmicutes bacterium]|nr:EamA family transporter [Bacillota bacterium]
MSNYFKGIFYTTFSAFLYGLSPWAVTFIVSQGGNSFSNCFLRCLLCLPFAFLLLLRLPREERKLQRAEIKQMIILALSLGTTMMMLIGSYSLVGTSMATSLHFSYPAFTLLGCLIFCKEKIRPLSAVCVGMTLVGVVLCYSPGHIGNLLGTLVAFASGATFAWYMIYLDKSGLSKMPPMKLAFYLHLFMAVLTGAVAVLAGKFPVSMSWSGWGMQLVLSLTLALGAATLLPMGIRHIGPQRASILSTFEPLTAILVGLLVLGEPYTGKTILGMTLILAAVVVLTLADGKQEKQPSE